MIVSCTFLSVFLIPMDTSAVVMPTPTEVKTYTQREIPRFTAEFVSEDFIISKNFRNPEYRILKELVELRNYFARCQNLLKVFYEDNFYKCDLLVLQGGTLESATSRHAFSVLSFSEPLLMKELPDYIDTIDKIDMSFTRKYRETLLEIPIEEIQSKFRYFLNRVTTSRLISSNFIEEDVYTLSSLMHGQCANLILQLKGLQNSQ